MNRRTRALNIIKDASSHYSLSNKALLARITSPQEYCMPSCSVQRGELFIHWWFRDRAVDKLSPCEIFHLNMLKYFDVANKVNTIHVRCSASNSQYKSFEEAIAILSSGKASLDFKLVNPNNGWEHDTFKEATEYAISSKEFVYYTHFKGVSRIGCAPLGIAPRLIRGSTDLDIYYWCYLMYLALFTAPNNVKAIGPLVHLGQNSSYKNRDISWSKLCKGNQVFHYCGSFQAFSGDYISSCLDACGMGDPKYRDSNLWVGDPYTVEMFLSMVSLKDDVYSLDVPYECTNAIYNVYSHNRIPMYTPGFSKLYI